MDNKEIKKKILSNIERAKGLKQLCSEYKKNEIEVLSLIHELKSEGNNIILEKYDDDIYVLDAGDLYKEKENEFEIQTNDNNIFKFIAISDPRLGSKYQQLSILNDIYKKGHDMGYENVIVCGNISAGYEGIDENENFISDTIGQANYIIDNYPKVEGMKTYFITGKVDNTHLKKKKIDIGKRIDEAREDMHYLGSNSCTINIDNTRMQVISSKLAKTYTVSYRAQQQVDSYRSEDKPDILLLGGLLQMEKFPYRSVNCITIPSVCATTKEMNEKRYSNAVGAWYITVKTNKKGMLESVNAIADPYYVTEKDDYIKSLVVKNKSKDIKKEELSKTDSSYVDKYYNYIKNNMNVELFKSKHHINDSELNALLELFSVYGKNVSLSKTEDGYKFNKKIIKPSPITKTPIDSKELIHSRVGVVSDTHFGNVRNQLHLVNEFYKECYLRGIDTILHVGDLVDGFYTTRPESPRQQFLHGFDEQAGYVVDMYPEIDGMKTYYILGSHDETHYKNGQATVNEWITRCRKDMIYLGQDVGHFDINKVKICLDHPGGGSAKSVSYKPQIRIEQMESHNKPNILLIGHYHKNYGFLYRNVHCLEVPALCGTTPFQQKQGLFNALGAYILNIYSDKHGNVQYFEPESIIYDSKDIWDEAGKDKKRVKKLVINNGIY